MLKKLMKKRLSIFFILPTIIVFAIFMFWPLIYTVYLSLYKWNMVSPDKVFVGLSNYADVLTDPLTLKLLGNTLLYIVIMVTLSAVVPYILAFAISFLIQRFKGVFKSLIFMPSIISSVVAAIVFSWIFNPISGPLAVVCGWFNITLPVWSKTEGLVIFVVSLVTIYRTFGHNFIVSLSGVNAVPDELIEAARLEKTSNFRIFTSIVAPLTASTGVYVLIMTIVQGLQYVFTPIKILTEGGPNDASSNIIYGVYREAFGYFNTGKASALSVITLLFFMVLLLIEFRFVEKGVYYEN